MKSEHNFVKLSSLKINLIYNHLQLEDSQVFWRRFGYQGTLQTGGPFLKGARGKGIVWIA